MKSPPRGGILVGEITTTMATIDINCDMGESFGAYTIGDDLAMLDTVTSANVACGFHGGDPEVMASTFKAAKDRGVAVGAHPGFPDLWGFGRRRLPYTHAEITRLVAYQIGAAMAMAALVGHKITHVKAHGALGNMAAEDADVAFAVAQAIAGVDRSLPILVIGGSGLERGADKAGIPMVYEIYADRAYTDDGQLVSRKIAGSVIHDPQAAAQRVTAMIDAGAVISVNGKKLKTRIDTICVHGDTPGAVPIGRAVRKGLEDAGHTLKPFAQRS